MQGCLYAESHSSVQFVLLMDCLYRNKHKSTCHFSFVIPSYDVRTLQARAADMATQRIGTERLRTDGHPWASAARNTRQCEGKKWHHPVGTRYCRGSINHYASAALSNNAELSRRGWRRGICRHAHDGGGITPGRMCGIPRSASSASASEWPPCTAGLSWGLPRMHPFVSQPRT